MTVHSSPPTGVVTAVVGFDDSPAARSAARLARKLVGGREEQIVLTGVRAEVPPFSAPALPGVERVTRSTIGREAHQELHAALAGYRDELGLSDSRLQVECGPPAERLMSVADAEGAELIVVGTRGQGATRAALLGTVAGSLLAHSSIPVLVVPAGMPEGDPRTIVCGVAATAGSRRAAAVAERLAHALACTFILVHVVASAEHTGWAEAMLSDTADELDAPGDIRRIVRTGGAVASQLLAVADKFGSAVIAVGPRGRGPVRAAFLGSTSRDILRAGRHALLATPPAAVSVLSA